MNKFFKIIYFVLVKIATAFLTALTFSVIVFFISGFFLGRSSHGDIFAPLDLVDAINAFNYSIVPLLLLSFLTSQYKMPKIYSIYEKAAFIIGLIVIFITLSLFASNCLYFNN